MLKYKARGPMDHKSNSQNHQQEKEDELIAKEMLPFAIYAAIPILIIVFIALKWGPSY
jgi:hypothetical protein